MRVLTPLEIWKDPVLSQIVTQSLGGDDDDNVQSFELYAQKFPWISFGARTWKEEDSTFYEIECDGLSKDCVKILPNEICGITWMVEHDAAKKVFLIRSM